jgi:hypothetical protein
MILLGAVSVSSISNSRRYSRILLASVFKCAFDTIWYVVSIVAFSEISLSNTKLILQTTVCSVTDENDLLSSSYNPCQGFPFILFLS